MKRIQVLVVVAVSKATGCELDAGKICPTSEGSEIHFRNITLTTTAK